MPIKTVEGDLLDATEDYVCHQCNCITKKGKGLSKVLFDKWPEANIYKDRDGKDTVGQIVVKGQVINMLAQIYPGKAKYKNDSKEKRATWFLECLEQMSELDGSFAFPFRIGCGLAGGDWVGVYLPMLERFAENREVVIYVKN